MVHYTPRTLRPDSTCHFCLMPSSLSASFLSNTVYTDRDLERVINTGIYTYPHILVHVIKACSSHFHAAGAAATTGDTGGCSQSDFVQPSPPVDTGEYGLVLKGAQLLWEGSAQLHCYYLQKRNPLDTKSHLLSSSQTSSTQPSSAGACTVQPE